jgi:hypothetical protein
MGAEALLQTAVAEALELKSQSLSVHRPYQLPYRCLLESF